MGLVQPIDTGSVLDFTHDWSDWLTAGELIATSTWAVVPTGELVIDSETETTTTATVWVSGMVKGHRYELTNEIVTDADRTAQRTITIRADNR